MAFNKLLSYLITIIAGILIIYVVFFVIWPGITGETPGLRDIVNVSVGSSKITEIEEGVPQDAQRALTILCNTFETYELAADDTCVVKYPDLPVIPEGYHISVDSLDAEDLQKKQIRVTLKKEGRAVGTCYIRNLQACYIIPKHFIARDYYASPHYMTNIPIEGDDVVNLANRGKLSISDNDPNFNYFFKTLGRDICFFITQTGGEIGPIYNEDYAFDNDAIGGNEGLFDVKYFIFPYNGKGLLEELPVCKNLPTHGDEIYTEAINRFNQAYYNEAVRGFESITLHYNHHLNRSAAEKTSFLTGLTYYKLKDFSKANTYFSLFLRDHVGSEYRGLATVYLNLSQEKIPQDEGCDLIYASYAMFENKESYFEIISKIKSVIDDYSSSRCLMLAKYELERFCSLSTGEAAAKTLCQEIEANKSKYYPEVES